MAFFKIISVFKGKKHFTQVDTETAEVISQKNGLHKDTPMTFDNFFDSSIRELDHDGEFFNLIIEYKGNRNSFHIYRNGNFSQIQTSRTTQEELPKIIKKDFVDMNGNFNEGIKTISQKIDEFMNENDISVKLDL